MKINNQLSDDQVLAELGARLARLRLNRDMTQSDLAKEAGVSLRTVQRMEAGAVATQLSGFLRMCRVLGIVERLDVLLPEDAPSPMALLKHQGKVRKRASGRRSPSVAEEEQAPWKWGDES